MVLSNLARAEVKPACAIKTLERVTADIGRECGLVDIPDSRKRHTGDIPLTGGVAIAIAAPVYPLLFDTPALPLTVGLIACAIFLMGVIDDNRQVPAAWRLTLHYLAGVLLGTLGGVAIHNVGNLLGGGDIALLALTVPLTALAVAGLCNAYNMIDGVGGLAGVTALLPLVVLYLIALDFAHPATGLLAGWIAALCAFLIFNLPGGGVSLPRVFLGDNGSVLLGFMVTVFLVHYSQGENALIRPVAALWLVTVPLMDMLSTMLRRYRHGRPLMRADRSHLHHALIDMGLSARQALLLLTCWSILCALMGLALENTASYISMALYFVVFAAQSTLALKSVKLADYFSRTYNTRAALNHTGE
ncbi:MAG: MraY family glycosyltransferase [Halioglobus sp.]